MSSTKPRSTRMDLVIDFNQEVLGIAPRKIGLQPPDEAALSWTQMREEANEFREAYENLDSIGCIDAVLDELYFCYGILYKMGIDEALVDEMFAAIHKANMAKKSGVKSGREGFNAADATKPVSWVDPRVAMTEILHAKINNT